jgi:Mrp family chromosome partitioning ATPase
MAMGLLGQPGDHRAGKVMLFTSTGRGEGKTALAVSFAAYAALLHRNVLVVDLDLPSPGLGDLLGAGAGPGALDVLRGVPLSDAVRRKDEFGIDYLPLAAARLDPLLLMADEGIHALLDEMRRRYDCVVIDGGALLGNPEVRVLVALADHVILALKWGSTDLDTARTAVNELVRARCAAEDDATVSSVLTQVEPRLYPSYADWPDEHRAGRRHAAAGEEAGSR